MSTFLRAQCVAVIDEDVVTSGVDLLSFSLCDQAADGGVRLLPCSEWWKRGKQPQKVQRTLHGAGVDYEVCEGAPEKNNT
ncbi:hypothetical protein EYF80_066072 [Liparis tanakae]|uniref:Uncharacterized protein n=1 Tax=Liparis tanakae TaxID=230148 RepID=A0A4Z2E4G4_9TELE|nr:hypothetical protein EYF80_066072 [Liparis tanakae]